MVKPTYEMYYNGSNKDISANDCIITSTSTHPNKIVGVAREKILKGEVGWIQTSGIATVNVSKEVDWYDKTDLDSILGVK